MTTGIRPSSNSRTADHLQLSLRAAEGKSPAWDGLGTWMVYSDDNMTTVGT